MVSKKTIAAVLLLGALLTAVVLSAGCVTEETGAADTLYLGNVITMDDDNPAAEAVAVKDGIIVFVGSKEDAPAFCDENTEIIDFGDYSIYPGFLEAHSHVIQAGIRDYGTIKLSESVPLSQTIKEFQAYIEKNPGKEYYIGSGWSAPGEEPTAAMLDAVCPDVPVILQSVDAHSVWVNSKEIEALNYSPEYIKEMGPQQIHVDADGKLTGYIQETPAIELFKNLPFTVEEMKGFFLQWQDKVLASGYTAVSDAGIELVGEKALQIYDELAREGKLKLRIFGLSLVNDNTDTPEEDMAKIYELAKKYKSEYFTIIGAKVFLDGVSAGHTAWMLEPYKDMPESVGVKRFSDTDKLARLITAADKYDMLVHGHAMGDGAAHMFADAVEKSVQETGNYDQRNAAAHLQFITEEDKERFGKYGIVAVSGYLWCPLSEKGVKVMGGLVGPEKAIQGFPAKSFINHGAVVVGHSDYPVSPVMSIPEAVYTAVSRTDPAGGTKKINTDELLTRKEALETVTTNVAYMWHEEDRMGSLEAGKLANMAVMSVDFLQDELEMIAEAAVTRNVATIVDGEIVYSAEPERLSDEEVEEYLRMTAELGDIWSQYEDIL